MLATELAWSAWESFLVAPELSTFPSYDDIMISNAENFAINQNLCAATRRRNNHYAK